MANKHIKVYFTSYATRKIQIKTRRNHYTPIAMSKIQSTENAKCWRRCGASGILIHCWWMQNGIVTMEVSLEISWKTKHNLTIRASNHTPLYLNKGTENLCSHKNLHWDVSINFIHSFQILKAIKIFPCRWMDI